MSSLIAEAAAICEAAHQEYERIQAELQKAIREGREIVDSWREETARQKLLHASAQITVCFTHAQRVLSGD